VKPFYKPALTPKVREEPDHQRARILSQRKHRVGSPEAAGIRDLKDGVSKIQALPRKRTGLPQVLPRSRRCSRWAGLGGDIDSVEAAIVGRGIEFGQCKESAQGRDLHISSAAAVARIMARIRRDASGAQKWSAAYERRLPKTLSSG